MFRLSNSRPAPPSFVEVSITLAVDDRTRHWLYFGRDRSDAQKLQSQHREDASGGTMTRKVKVYDGRDNQALTLDGASFELVQNCHTKLSTEDFYELQAGDSELQQAYYREVEDFVKREIGCDRVIVFHSQVRNASMAGERAGVQQYAGLGPHTDSSAVSADQLALSMTDSEDYGRYLYLNLWRSIADCPIEDNHLAMLDERSTVKPDDYIPKDLFGPGYSVVQYGLNARHVDVHKWYHYPRMTKDEAILFKQFDSDWTKTGRTCFHMSISDPDAKNPKPRESIEARMICFWKRENCSVDSMPTKENTSSDMIQDPENVAELDVSILESFSFLDLIRALIAKLPLLGWLVRSTAPPKYKYTGNPEDYVARFVQAVDYFSSWPQAGVTWARNEMNSAKTVDEGIVAITRVLVEDTLHYQKTKFLQPSEKQHILTALLESEQYQKVAQKHFASLVE